MLKKPFHVLTAIIFFAALWACANSAISEEKDSKLLEPINPRTEWESHISRMPEPVWKLFYAIKNSLDYGIITGMGEPSPEEDISEYRLVTPQLLSSVQSDFNIAQYEVRDMDYTLILVNKSNPGEKYMATRMETFSWERDGWKSLGKYVYL